MNDPLTAAFWPVNETESILLDPEISLTRIEDSEPSWVRTSAARPPSVDQILRGEYTGWIPVIKAGESLQDAESRVAEKIQRIEAEIAFEETLSTADLDIDQDRTLPSEVLEPLIVTPPLTLETPARKTTAWTELVEDPDTAKSPADALEEARRRIQAMRDSLQYNVRRVTESFEHPIFNDVVVEDIQEINEAPDADQPVVNVAAESALDGVPDTFDEAVPEPPRVQATPTVVIDAPRVEKEYITSAPMSEAVAETKAPDTSLELMIMRDEIKDLRTRLDASQKLIEDLMHRLTNLTELALKSRQN